MIPAVVGRQQGRGARAGPRDHQRGDAERVGGEPGRGQRLDVRGGRDKDPLAEVPARAARRQLVVEAHAGRARLDHRLHELERVRRAADAGLGADHDRGQPPGQVPVRRLPVAAPGRTAARPVRTAWPSAACPPGR